MKNYLIVALLLSTSLAFGMDYNIDNIYVGEVILSEEQSNALEEICEKYSYTHETEKEKKYYKELNKQPQNPVIEAAKKGDLHTFKSLLVENPNLNCKGYNGTTPLLQAIFYGHFEIVKFLVDQKNTDLFSRDRDGNTPLLLAVERVKNIETIKLLIQKIFENLDTQINCSTLYDDMKKAIKHAVTYKNFDAVQFLIEQAIVNDQKTYDDIIQKVLASEDNDVLHSISSVDELKVMLGYGFNVNSQNRYHLKALDLICATPNYDEDDYDCCSRKDNCECIMELFCHGITGSLKYDKTKSLKDNVMENEQVKAFECFYDFEGYGVDWDSVEEEELDNYQGKIAFFNQLCDTYNKFVKAPLYQEQKQDVISKAKLLRRAYLGVINSGVEHNFFEDLKRIHSAAQGTSQEAQDLKTLINNLDFTDLSAKQQAKIKTLQVQLDFLGLGSKPNLSKVENITVKFK